MSEKKSSNPLAAQLFRRRRFVLGFWRLFIDLILLGENDARRDDFREQIQQCVGVWNIGEGERIRFKSLVPTICVAAGQMFACSQFVQLALRVKRRGIALCSCFCNLPGVDGHGEAPEVQEGKVQCCSHRRRAIDRRQ